MTDHELSRRSFIRTALAAGGGMVLGFHLPGRWEAEAAVARQTSGALWEFPKDGTEINAWLEINPAGIVTVRVPHSDMGQGGLTSVASMVAEELDVPWANVRAVLADANRHVTRGQEYKEMNTGGSNLVRLRHPHIMQAGASARERLKEAAAQKWGVPRSAVIAKQGVLSSGSHRGSYGEFATAAAAVKLAEEPKIKAYGDWWLLGKDLPRMEAASKIDGSAIYPIDVKVPGMVFAAVKACPVPGGVLKSFNFEAIRNRPGVIAAVELKQTKDKLANTDLRSAVAVVADSFYRAQTALNLMPIEWDLGPGSGNSSAAMASRAGALLNQDGPHVAAVRGDPRPMLADSSERRVSGNYDRPYECHVPLCPPAAVAHVTAEKAELWCFTQNAALTLTQAADQLGRDPKDVFVYGTLQGGAFGSGLGMEIPRQAVEISRQVGRPVKLVWSREEDVLQSKARPPVWARFEAALESDGLPKAMLIRAVGVNRNPEYTDRNLADMPYAVPHFRFERHVVETNVPVGPNRAPGNNNNGFLIESFVDELAAAGNWDPIDWRLKMTAGKEPWQRVLLKLKEVSGFTRDLPKGRGMGIAVVESHGSVVAACATVEVSKKGKLAVEKVLIVANSGWVINPRAGADQLAGSVGWELSHVLNGGLQLENGRFQNVNFDTYELLRFEAMPEVEVVYALSKDKWWGGLGEPAVPPTPPAIANAIWAATGKRVRSTPILKHDLSWA